MKNQLIIQDLFVSTKTGKQIVDGVNLKIKTGEIHILMGPNGSGKSTLTDALMGHPEYKITSGKLILNGQDITNFPIDKKAKLGLFLGFQYPIEVAGVNFAQFLRMAVNEQSSKRVSPVAFRNILKSQAKKLSLKDEIIERCLNEGFSGGEKKKAEILQLSLLKPKFAILDEPDSGLDADALKYLFNFINNLDFPLGMLLITHNQRILHFVKADFVHIMIKGEIVKSGDFNLVEEIERSGYAEFA
ncbi:Fe-S cluster assembly ATPase SufC [Candidatus Daviesbacteria bacterium]|nr:Fe-S cluster assembly ATPase SufC [Candidatus Daviesbacteria bacterium]